MSFILDALRKSEIERQRQSGPSIAELPVARVDRRLPVALLAIGVLLAVNVGVLVFFLMRDAEDAPAAAALPPAADTATVAMAPPTAVAMQPAAPAPAASDDPTASGRMAASPAPRAMDPATLAPEAPDPTLLPGPPAGAMPGRVTYAAAPPPTELPGAVDVGLPELTVDLHIYADDPAKRAVFINGRRYTQGATIAEGPLLEEITRDGAVLSYRGRRFQLPRM